MSGLFAMMKEKWFPPLNRPGSLEGKTVLITGTNTGLGLEASKQAAALNAERLIITTRSQSKGEHAKDQIRQSLVSSGSGSKTEIISLVLEMSTADGVKSFIKNLESTTKKLDLVIVNAGINQPTCQISSDGYEMTLQVNTVSTVFLAMLLLPLLASTAESSNAQTHITFVSSRSATDATAAVSHEIQASTTPIHKLAQPENFPQQALGGTVRYGQSKLLLEYAIRRMNELPIMFNKTSERKVIVNSVCPGTCNTDLGRNYKSWALNFIMYAFFIPLFSKSAAKGADALLVALTAGEESSGKMWTVTQYLEEWDSLRSAEGKVLGDKVWQELQVMMIDWDAQLKDILR